MSPSILLRCQLSDFLIEVPGLLSKANELSVSYTTNKSDLYRDFTLVVCCLLSRIRSWYDQNVIPLICGEKPNNSEQPNGIWRERNYPDLLFAVLDCVVCSLLAKLSHLATHLGEKSSGSNIWHLITPSTGLAYTEIASGAYSFVQQHSYVMGKQLAFGQSKLNADLWTTGG